jgi:hypothetical protein
MPHPSHATKNKNKNQPFFLNRKGHNYKYCPIARQHCFLSSILEHHKFIYHPSYTAPTHSKSDPLYTKPFPKGLIGSFNGPRNRTRRGPEPESHSVVHAPMKPNLSPAVLSSHTLLALNDIVLTSNPSLRHVDIFSLPQAQPAQAHIHQVPISLRPQLPHPILVSDPIHNRYETRKGLDALDPGVSSQEHHVLRNLLVRSLHDAHTITVALVLPAGPPPPLALRSLQNHEEEAVLLAGDRREVELPGDWDLPASIRPGEVGRELLRRDSDLAAHDRLEGLEFQRRVDDDVPDVGLALPVGEDHRDGGAVGDLHHGRYDIR